MKLKIALVIVTTASSVAGQSAFQKPDFESAILSPSGSGSYPPTTPINAALPGWTAYLGAVEQAYVLQNAQTFGAASIDIFGPNYPAAGPQTGIYPGIIDGNFTAMLQAGAAPPFGDSTVNASLAQDGTVPSGMESIEWKAWSWGPSSAVLAVSFGGNSLSPVVLGSGANYTMYGADISPFAGQTGPLVFTSVFSSAGPSWIELDDIAFSTQAVPEPSPLVLMSLGGLLWTLSRRCTRRRR